MTNTLRIHPHIKQILILLTSVIIASCATIRPLTPQSNSLSQPPEKQITNQKTLAQKTSDASATKSNDDVENKEDMSEPPLFTLMKPSVDTIMWTNETEKNFSVPTGEPVIAGRLPGQRELPIDLYEEAAQPHPLYQHGSIVFINKTNNLWDRIRRGFELPAQRNRRINQNIAWYANHPAYLNRVVTRARKYLYLIVGEMEKADVPLEISLLPVVESAFQPFAYSHGRAAGIWQFIPGTGKLYGLRQNWWYDGRRDIKASTEAAISLLTEMKNNFNGDWLLALAAYNSGWGTVEKAIRKNKRHGKPISFWDLDLPRETEGYVPKLLAIADIINNPAKYGIKLDPIPNKPVVAEVDTGSQIDLALAAELAETSLEEIYVLNPAFNRWATDPRGNHKLLVPVEQKEIFEKNLAELPISKRLSWKRHKIRHGESLLAIADKFNTTVRLIKEVNQIRGNMIREGQNLVIPVSSRNGKAYALSKEQRLLALQNTRRKGKAKDIYFVRNGDSWWTISRKFNVDYRSLAKWNGLAPRDTLRPGQKLVVWTKHSAIHHATFSPHYSKLVTQKINYRVRRGDSLARISVKFNVDIDDLKRWNHKVSKQKYLQPGQHLQLYVDVTTLEGS